MPHIIFLDEIEKSDSKTVCYDFEDFIEGVNSQGPISAELSIRSLGDFIEVTGNVKGILNSECDLCLKEFRHKIDFDIEELFAKQALQENYAQDTELKEGQFVTDLNGSDQINIYDLLYQSVILNIQNKKVCGINCMGNNFLKEEELPDPRMDVFKNIQIQPKNK